MRKSCFLRCFALLLCLLVLSGLFSFSIAQGTDEVFQITGRYRSKAFPEMREWTYDFCDGWFALPADEYHHGLARASFGLATSAFRDLDAPIEDQDWPLLDYLAQAGFTDLVSIDYKRVPTADTVATVMGRKKIGDTTVIAAAVCGGGYQNEWKSNLKVGDEPRHVGFNEASHQVQDRIRAYLTEYGITGDCRLWISGYSRAAAVSNITAADMTDSGLFSAVYAYTFATPRTTRDPGHYANIFNILGKNDPVPCIPLADWGYVRYGTDLFTPSLENDSDFLEKAVRAEPVALSLTGLHFRVNPEMNYYIRNVLDYLYMLFPTSADYENGLQDIAISLWGASSEETVVADFAAIMERYSQLATDGQETIAEMLDYIQSILYVQVTGNTEQISAGYWDEASSTADNLGHEHNPDAYLEWLFSAEDPLELYSDAAPFYRFVASGKGLTVDVYDINGFVERVAPNGKVIYDPAEAGEEPRLDGAPEVMLYSRRTGDQTILAVPQDEDYLITVSAPKDTEISYLATSYSVHSLPAQLGIWHKAKLTAGDPYFIIFSDNQVTSGQEENEELIRWDSNLRYSPSLMLSLENMNVFHLTVEDLLVTAFVVTVVLILAIILAILMFLFRLILRRKRRARSAVFFCALMVFFFFLLAELARMHLTRLVWAYTAMKLAAGFLILMLAARGAVRNRTRTNGMIVLFLMVCMAGDALLNKHPNWGLLCFGVGQLLLCAAFWMEKKPTKKTAVLWLGIWAVLTVLLFAFRSRTEGRLIPLIVYAAVLVGTVLLGCRCRKVLLTGAVAFALSDLWLAVNKAFSAPFWSNTCSLALYYTALLILAASTWTRVPRVKAAKAETPADAGKPSGE